MTGWVRVLVTVTTVLLSFALGRSAAVACELVDPGCTTAGTSNTSKGAAGDAAGTVGTSADDTLDTAQAAADGTADGAQRTAGETGGAVDVGDTVDAVQGTAGGTVDSVQAAADADAKGVGDTLDPILGGGDPGAGDPGSGPGGGPGGEGNGGPNGGGSNGGGGRESAGAPSNSGGRALDAGAGGSAAGTIVAAPAGTASVDGSGLAGALTSDTIPSSGRGDGSIVARAAAGVIGGVALMVLLLGAVAVFLMMQDRLDRRDPKLLAASIASDEVPFS